MDKETRDSRENGFGAYLREGRTKAGLSYEEVSKKLFISEIMLENLEAENHPELLEPVFVSGFVRSYADFLGLRVERALLLYKESYRRWQAVRTEALRRARRKKYMKAWLGGGLATFLLIFFFTFSVLVLIHFFVMDKKTVEKEEPHTEQTFAERKTTVQRKLHLEVFFSEPNWLKIMVDGNQPQFFTLTPGEKLEFDAEKTYNIMLGNSAGVRLLFNGKYIPVSGTGGQAVALFLP